MPERDTNGLSRRKMLKGSAAGALVAFGSTNAAGKRKTDLTQAEREDLLQDYRDVQVVQDLVHQQSDVLEELAADGVLDDPTIDDLEELSEPDNGVGERLSTYQLGEQHTPEIKVFRRIDEGYLSLSILPEKDIAYAVLNPVENGEPLGEDHLVTYGSLPKGQPEPQQSCWWPGHCWECRNCHRYCCEFDASGDCMQYCYDCDCACYSDAC